MKKIIIATMLFLLCFSLFATDYALVVNKGIAISEITKADVKNIFLGKKTTWDDGTGIIVSMVASGPEKESFLKEVVKKNESLFNTFWKKAVFTGTGTPPKEFATPEELVKFVSSNPGAIGIIPSSKVTADVKALNIK